MKAGAVRKLSGSELRALRDQRAAADPAAEAWAHESSFLRCLATAQEDFDWIVANTAWTLLGHDTFAGWWDSRAPRMRALGFQPTKQIALAVLAQIRADEELLPKTQRRTNRQLAASVGLSEASVRRTTSRSLPATDDAEDDLGETAADGPHPPTADAVEVPGDRAEEAVAPDGGLVLPSGVTPDSPAADSLPPQAHAGVPAAGGQIEERDEEQQRPWDVVWTSVGNGAEIDRQTFDSYRLALAEMDRSRRAGSIAEVDVEPTPTDSPTGLEAAQPRDDRSETDSSAGPDQPVATTVLPGIDHHDGAGVSLSGEALPVESAGALLEDGDAAVTPSSSDPDDERDEPSATDLLLMTFGALIKLIDHMDAAAVGPVLFPAELEQLHQYVEQAEAFVRNLSRARFEALTRTP